eukprot:COSAG01_NODE_39110_length_481_cov_0.541885_1_plen_62_part_01
MMAAGCSVCREEPATCGGQRVIISPSAAAAALLAQQPCHSRQRPIWTTAAAHGSTDEGHRLV